MKSNKSALNNNLPTLIDGGSHIDSRGTLNFVNDITFFDFKRFYIIENFQNNFVRAWHGHKNENKLLYCISGTFKVGAIKINNFNKPSKSAVPHEFILSSLVPKILFIPKGFANGLMNLEKKSKIMVFSDKSLLESQNDDYRFKFDFWDIWKIKFE